MFILLKGSKGLGDVRLRVEAIGYYILKPGDNVKGSRISFVQNGISFIDVQETPEQIDALISDAWKAPINNPLP